MQQISNSGTKNKQLLRFDQRDGRVETTGHVTSDRNENLFIEDETTSCQRHATRTLRVHCSLTNRTNARRRAASIVKPGRDRQRTAPVQSCAPSQCAAAAAMMQDGWLIDAGATESPMPCSPVSECPLHATTDLIIFRSGLC